MIDLSQDFYIYLNVKYDYGYIHWNHGNYLFYYYFIYNNYIQCSVLTSQ